MTRRSQPPPDDELPLFARGSDPDTSHAAMAQFDRATMRNAADAVVALYEHYGPMADYELEPRFRTVWPTGCHHLYRQARSIARDDGRLEDTGARVVNPHTQRRQIVWARCRREPLALAQCPTCGHVLRRGLRPDDDER